MELNVESAQPLETVAAETSPSPSAVSVASSPHKRRLEPSIALLLRDQSHQYRGHASISALLTSHGIAHSGVFKQVPGRDSFILFADEQQRAEASSRMQAVQDEEGRRVFRNVREADWTPRGGRKEDKRAKRGEAEEHKESAAEEAEQVDEAEQGDV